MHTEEIEPEIERWQRSWRRRHPCVAPFPLVCISFLSDNDRNSDSDRSVRFIVPPRVHILSSSSPEYRVTSPPLPPSLPPPSLLLSQVGAGAGDGSIVSPRVQTARGPP